MLPTKTKLKEKSIGPLNSSLKGVADGCVIWHADTSEAFLKKLVLHHCIFIHPLSTSAGPKNTGAEVKHSSKQSQGGLIPAEQKVAQWIMGTNSAGGPNNPVLLPVNNPYNNHCGIQSYCVRQEDRITVVNILELILDVYKVANVVGGMKY